MPQRSESVNKPDFAVVVLLYGDYPKLAERVLKSLARSAFQSQFRLWIGCNDISSATSAVVKSYLPKFADASVVNGVTPYYKYPLLRQIFYRTKPSPLALPYVMHFDDDSWITEDAPDNWFVRVGAEMSKVNMLGDIWWRRLNGNQYQFIEDQPWYTGKPVLEQQRVNFITGGWWTIQSDILRKHNWPIPELQHNGGDTLLGELFRQQGYKMGEFRTGLAINADDDGRFSKAPRRGTSQPMCGYDYVRK